MKKIEIHFIFYDKICNGMIFFELLFFFVKLMEWAFYCIRYKW